MGVFLLYCIQDWHSLRLLSGLNCDHCILCYVAVQTCLKKKKVTIWHYYCSGVLSHSWFCLFFFCSFLDLFVSRT